MTSNIHIFNFLLRQDEFVPELATSAPSISVYMVQQEDLMIKWARALIQQEDLMIKWAWALIQQEDLMIKWAWALIQQEDLMIKWARALIPNITQCTPS